MCTVGSNFCRSTISADRPTSAGIHDGRACCYGCDGSAASVAPIRHNKVFQMIQTEVNKQALSSTR